MINLFKRGLISNEKRDGGLMTGRRSFMRNLGLGAAGAAALGATGIAKAANGANDVDVLNFALNLEYLEAEFYLHAYTGSGLPASDIGANPGQVTGGRKVNFSSSLVAAYAQEIAQDEKNHVEFLRAALGSYAVDRPTIDIGQAFTTVARAAGLISNTQTFDPYASDTNFLLAAYIFEDVGVTAYHGAAGFLVDNLTYLDKAAGILAVEAYHAGLVRTVLFAMNQSRQTQLISNLRQALGTVPDRGVGVIGAPTIVLVDGNSIAYDRTTRQVLNIVYGAQNANHGLFFPAGLNGNIK